MHIAIPTHVRADDLATCVSCGLCLNDCPTYRVLGEEADSPRGRIQLIRELVGSEGPPEETLVSHLDACLVCRACETVCPSLVPFGRIMEDARETVRARRAERLRTRLVRSFGFAIVVRPWLLGLATATAGLYVRSGLQALLRRSRLLPRRLARLDALLASREGPGYVPVEQPGADATFFAGCVMRAAFGETQRATVRLLERGGQRVTAPRRQVCCGALHAHTGDADGARVLARRNIAAFEDGEAPIVVTAAGCGAQLKAYGELLAEDPEWAARARRFAARVRDASEVVSPQSVAPAAPRPLRVAYQDACHLAHGQRIRLQPRALLGAMRGVSVVPVASPERCCGSAGVYNLTHPEVADELQRDKAEALADARPDVVVSANPGCILQIAAGLREAGEDVPVVHLMRFLEDPARALS